jgi:hypothetical protein
MTGKQIIILALAFLLCTLTIHFALHSYTLDAIFFSGSVVAFLKAVNFKNLLQR